MSQTQATQAAAKYMRDQAAVMRKYGETPKVSGPKFASAVRATARTFQAISKAK